VPQLANDKRFAARLEQLLQSENGVESVRINPRAASIVIRYQEQLIRDIHSYLAALIEKASWVNHSVAVSHHNKPKSEGEEWSNLALPVLATLLSLATRQLKFLRPAALSSLITAAFPVAQRAIKSLWVDRKFNIDCLDLLALIFSGLQGQLLTPSLIVTLHELGDIIRDRTARSTETQTGDLLEAIGHFAWVERGGEIVQIDSKAVEVGEIVVVYPGEQIPVDGIVSGGEAIIDQQQLTGESMPIVARAGTYVYASTLVRSGKIRLLCERVGNQTRAAASIELLQKAPVHDTRMANYAAKIADKLIMPSLILAGVVLLATREPARAASILTLDFVTGIRVSMPTAFLGALNHTTRHGVLVRSGRTLELLSEVDTIVFDKTGTLTRGDIVVVGVETLAGGLPRDRVLQLAASAEQRITHPVAEAIARYTRNQGIEILPRGKWQYEMGLGMRAEIEGQTVLVGSEKFLRQEGVDLDNFYLVHPCIHETYDLEYKSPLSEWLSLIYVACEGEFQGVIQYTDPLRPESRDLIHRLQHDYGMSVHLLTGDNQQRATQVGTALNIPSSQVHAEAFPEQKAKIVRDLHRSGRTVAFVGDGLNDSVALAYADVSISFQDGSEVARETADVVLMNNDLSSILEAIAIARETKNLIEQNTLLVVGPNLVALGLASTVGLNPLLATGVHNGTAIAAGLNSLRPLVIHQLETRNNQSITR
jgi:Cu2+-exporting ATPase